MSLSKKLNRWKEAKLITSEQCEQILSFERRHSGNLFWRTAFIIAGLLIGLGICLLIAANWDALGATVKLTATFIILGGFFYTTFWCITHQRKKLTELFAILSFLMIGGTIGLIGQVFHLAGGWHSFALSWALLGFPFVAVSRSLFFNIGWWCLVFSTFPEAWMNYISRFAFDTFNTMTVLVVVILCLLSHTGKILDEAFHDRTLLPKSFGKLTMWITYATVWYIGLYWGGKNWEHVGTMLLANLFVFLFFAARMYLAIKTQNLTSFRRNAILTEIYICILFFREMGSLFLSGLGFIAGGLVILGMIYVFRYTARHIKTMEVFK